jgi:hypothetical protein
MKTLKFLGKSLIGNTVIVEQEQKWWLAILIMLIAMVASVGGTLYSGLTSSASTISSTAKETAIDKGFARFADDIDEAPNNVADISKNNIVINDGTLTATGKFTPTLLNNVTVTTIIAPQATYTHEQTVDNVTTDVSVLKVYLLSGIDPVASTADSTLLSTFVTTSIYQYDSSSAATVIPVSFLILTPTSIHMSTFKALGGTKSDSAVASISGKFTNIDKFDFYSIKSDTEDLVTTKMINLLNTAYEPIKIVSAWEQTGIYFAMNIGITIIGGFIFWIISKSKSSMKHFNFWGAQKVMYFMSLTPAIITFIMSFIISAYASFIFLLIMAFRIMSVTTKLSINSSAPDNKPVYKARS